MFVNLSCVHKAVIDVELSAMRAEYDTLRVEQETAVRAAIACLNDELSVAEANKETAVRQLRETTAEGHRAMVEHTKTLAALERQICTQRAVLTQTERSLEAVCKSRREEETRLSHQQLMCRTASDELTILEDKARKIRLEIQTAEAVRSQSKNCNTATSTTAAATTANFKSGSDFVRMDMETSKGGHSTAENDSSSNQHSSSSLRGNVMIKTTVVAATDNIASLPPNTSIIGRDTNNTVDPTATSIKPPPPPPLREQIAKLRQQSQQVLRNNQVAAAVSLRPYNVNNNNNN